jgi:hypothetical protein
MNTAYVFRSTQHLITVMVLLIWGPTKASVRAVHVAGTVANIQSWEIRGYYTAVMVRTKAGPPRGAVERFPGVLVDMKTGRFEGDLNPEVIRNAFGQWVDLHIVAISTLDIPHRAMVVRVPYARNIDLGTFDLKPSHYRWKTGALVIDTAVPRDSLIGDPFGNHVVVNPINPTPQDTVRFTFRWGTNNPARVASLGGLYMKDCCTYLCDLTFAERTDTEVYGESWWLREKLCLAPPLAPGRYRLRQTPASGEHLRDVDFLLNKDLYFTVGERTEP